MALLYFLSCRPFESVAFQVCMVSITTTLESEVTHTYPWMSRAIVWFRVSSYKAMIASIWTLGPISNIHIKRQLTTLCQTPGPADHSVMPEYGLPQRRHKNLQK